METKSECEGYEREGLGTRRRLWQGRGGEVDGRRIDRRKGGEVKCLWNHTQDIHNH